jgi:hypothetical protein
MPYVSIRSYQVSVWLVLLLAACIVAPTIALAYLWTTRSATIAVEEPLLITSVPSVITTHPGENSTLTIIVENRADIDYSVWLSFAVNDTDYQQTYMQFSNLTYVAHPGSNNLTAWLVTDRKAPIAQLSLTIEFYRE